MNKEYKVAQSRIKEALHPSFEYDEDIDLREGRRAISDYRKITKNPIEVLSLQICYVEHGTNCTLEYGDISSRFYDSLCSMLDSIVKGFSDLPQSDTKPLLPRIEKVHAAVHWMGWGYGDYLTDCLSEIRELLK